MKSISYLLTYLIVLCVHPELKSQTIDVNPKIRLKGKIKANKLLIRWVVYDQDQWYVGLSAGYRLSKYHIESNSKTLEWSRIIKPVSKSDWKRTNDTASESESLYALLYLSDQALIDELPKKSNGENFEYTKEELKGVRYLNSLIAANYNYQSALLQGVAYEDGEVKKGESYEYILHAAQDSISLLFDPKLTAAPILPPRPEYNAGDIHTSFYWDAKTRFDTYHSYVMESSGDGTRFINTSGNLSNYTHNAVEKGFRESFYWKDSIEPGLDKWYRLRGIDYFGEINSAGPMVRIHYPVRIPGPIALNCSIDADEYKINWYYDPAFETYVDHFQIWVRDSLKGDRRLFKDHVHRSWRSFDVPELLKTQYYSIQLIRLEGNPLESFPIMVTASDNVPPAKPRLLSAFCDSTGIVLIQWQRNKEPDVDGYRVFKSNDLHDEFSQVTRTVIPDSSYTDTVTLNAINRYIYYKIAAEDLRGNLSVLSEPITVTRYDTIPPSPPQIYQWQPEESSVLIRWYPSSSHDVRSTYLLRKDHPAADWEVIKSFSNLDSVGQYLDENIHEDSTYVYSLKCIDQSGNMSPWSEPVAVRSLGVLKYPAVDHFSISYDTARVSNIISWTYLPDPVSEFWIYRGEGTQPASLLITLDGVLRSWRDQNIQKGKTYMYRIKALMQNGRDSYFSKPVIIQTR
jgi:hypothetical protein